MQQFLRTGKATLVAVFLIATVMLLAACGSSSNASSGSSGDTTLMVAATATKDVNHTSLAQLVGNPTAKATAGTSFEVTGQIKNLDTKQHDIFIKATLTDVSGKVVGTSETTNVDNIKGGAIGNYDIDGTLTQPTWKNVTVTIVKVTENINGSGND